MSGCGAYRGRCELSRPRSMLPKPAPKSCAYGRPRSKPMLNMEAALLRHEMKNGVEVRVCGAW